MSFANVVKDVYTSGEAEPCESTDRCFVFVNLINSLLTRGHCSTRFCCLMEPMSNPELTAWLCAMFFSVLPKFEVSVDVPSFYIVDTTVGRDELDRAHEDFHAKIKATWVATCFGVATVTPLSLCSIPISGQTGRSECDVIIFCPLPQSQWQIHVFPSHERNLALSMLIILRISWCLS